MPQAETSDSTPPGGDETTAVGLPALVYRGEVIHERHEMLSLTDMWRAAKSDEQKAPAKWRALPATKSFVEHVALTVGKSDSDLFHTQNGGRVRGTWAHWQVAMAYAKYLDHDFHMWCNRVVRERMERVAHQAVALADEDRRAIGGIAKGVVTKALGDLMPGFLAEALERVLPGMIADRLEADARAVVIGFKPALMVLDEKKVPPRRRRAFSQKVSARLRRFSADRGYETRISRESGRWLFQVEAINAWLAHEGEQLIRDHVAGLDGQGILQLVRP